VVTVGRRSTRGARSSTRSSIWSARVVRGGTCQRICRHGRPCTGVVTDTAGLLITVAVLAASWQDRDGGKTALLGTYLSSPIRHVFADQGFAGRFVDWAGTTLKTTSTPPHLHLGLNNISTTH
jgi:hypothetical protein